LSATGGGFTEINFNEKFKLYGSAAWRTRVQTESMFYKAVDEKGQIQRYNLKAASHRFQAEINIESDLGRLISPRLTGISLKAGMNWNRFQVDYDKELNYQAIQPRAMLMNINQTQIKVGISVSPSTIFKRGMKSKKYRDMIDLY
jgi:hypothetical protein